MKHFTIKALLLTVISLFVGINVAEAENIQLGKSYNLAVFSETEFTYRATADGLLVAKKSSDQATLFFSWLGAEDDAPEIRVVGAETRIPVKAGKTYSYNIFAMDATTITFEYRDSSKLQLNVLSVMPAPGSRLSMTDIDTPGEVSLTCDFIGTYTSVSMASGSMQSSECTPDVYPMPNQHVGVGIIKAMTELYNRGLKAGDNVTVTIKGLRDQDGNLYNGNGTYTINYTAAARPLELVSTTFKGGNFDSYYSPAGTDGVWTFTFSGAIDGRKQYGTDSDYHTGDYLAGPILEMGAEGPNDACYKYFNTKLSADGKTITVDVRGKDLGNFNGFASYGVTFKLLNIYDTNGQMALGRPESGNIGSYPFDINYRELEIIPLIAKWYPAAGSSIESESTLTFTYTNAYRVLSWEGVKFTSGSSSVTVPKSSCRISENSWSSTVTVTIPEQFKKAKDVTVTMVGIVGEGGYDYNNPPHVMAVFNQTEQQLPPVVTPDDPTPDPGVDEKEYADLTIVVPHGLSISQDRIEISFADADIEVNEEVAESLRLQRGSIGANYIPTANGATIAANRAKYRDDAKKVFYFKASQTLINGSTYNLTVPAELFYKIENGKKVYSNAATTSFTISNAELLDGIPFTAATDIYPMGEISYTREIESTNGYQTWFVPFNVTVSEMINGGYVASSGIEYQIFAFDAVGMDPYGNIMVVFRTMKSGETMTANTPYIFKPRRAGTITYTFSNRVIKSANSGIKSANLMAREVGEYSFEGTYETKVLDNSYAFDGDRTFTLTNGEYVAPFRAYLRPSADIFALPQTIGIDFNGSVTLVEEIITDLTDKDAEIYDLDGRKVTNPERGIYIVNGHKIMIK